MGLFNIVGSTATDALQATLMMAQERHRILADNVANIDTPGYRAHDLDTKGFEKALAKAIQNSRRQNPNQSRLGMPDLDPEVKARLNNLVFHDANDRSVEQLMIELNKNASRHTTAANLLRNQNSLIKAVISETV